MRFKDLSEKAKTKAHYDFLDWFDFSPDWEIWREYQEEILTKKGWIEPKVLYDLGYHQGAGACFEFKGLNIKQWLQDWGYLDTFKELIAAFDELGLDDCDIVECVVCNHHYYHSNSRGAILTHYTGEVDQKFTKQLEKLQELLQEKYRDDAREVEKEGRTQLEELSDEAFAEDFFENNEFEFAEDGEQI